MTFESEVAFSAKGMAVFDMVSKLRVVGKFIQMMSLKATAALAALLTGIVVSLVDSISPSDVTPGFAFQFVLGSCAVFPVRGLFREFAQVFGAAILATKNFIAGFGPSSWAAEISSAVCTFQDEITAGPSRIPIALIGLTEAFARTVFAAAPFYFRLSSDEGGSANPAHALNGFLLISTVALVGTEDAFCGRSSEELNATVGASDFFKFHVTLLAQGVGMYVAGQFAAKSESSKSMISRFLAPHLYFTTGVTTGAA